MPPVPFTIPLRMLYTPNPPQLTSALDCVFADPRVLAISVIFDDTQAGMLRSPSVHVDDGNGLRTLTAPDDLEALAIPHLAQALYAIGWAWGDAGFHAERADVWEHLHTHNTPDRGLPELFFTRHGAALRRATTGNLALHFLAGVLRPIDPDTQSERYHQSVTGWITANPFTIGVLLIDAPKSAHQALSLAPRTQALAALWERLALINTPLSFPITLQPPQGS